MSKDRKREKMPLFKKQQCTCNKCSQLANRRDLRVKYAPETVNHINFSSPSGYALPSGNYDAASIAARQGHQLKQLVSNLQCNADQYCGNKTFNLQHAYKGWLSEQ